MKKCKCSDELLQDSVVKCPKCASEELETDLDLTGVPYGNREKEIERKRKDVEAEKERNRVEAEKLRLERERIEALKNNPNNIEAHYQKEAERTGVDPAVLKEMDIRARQATEQANREKEEANLAINSMLDSLQNGDYPAIAKYRNEIISEMKIYAVAAQKNPDLIKKIAFAVLGQNEATKKETKKPVPVVQNPTLSGAGSGGSPSKPIQLSDDELEFANRYHRNNSTEQEIRNLYATWLKTHPKK